MGELRAIRTDTIVLRDIARTLSEIREKMPDDDGSLRRQLRELHDQLEGMSIGISSLHVQAKADAPTPTVEFVQAFDGIRQQLGQIQDRIVESEENWVTLGQFLASLERSEAKKRSVLGVIAAVVIVESLLLIWWIFSR